MTDLPRRVKDLTGKRYGRLLVLAFDNVNSRKQSEWLCRCDCGTEKVISSQHLGKHTNSCGCLHSQNVRRRLLKHGMTHSPEYKAWRNMLSRVDATSGKYWEHYWNIKVCDHWRESFQSFYQDMGPRPAGPYSLHRVDPAGDYTPENTVWAHIKIQNQFRNKNKNNSSGTPGVSKRTYKSGRVVYTAKIVVSGKEIWLGTYPTVKLASAARRKAEQIYTQVIE